MRSWIKFALTGVALVLASCGGGGGSGGDSKLAYTISLRAAKTQLPINIANQPAALGANAPFTTTLYVDAREGGSAIQGGKDIFACNVKQNMV